MKNIKTYIFSKFLALKRRLKIFIFGKFDPYPEIPRGYSFSPSEFIQHQSKDIFAKYKISKNNIIDINLWKFNTKKKFKELLKVKDSLIFKIIKENHIPIKQNLNRKRLYVEFQKHRHAPIDIISKNDNFKNIFICMQGTNSGAHLNLEEIRMPADVLKISNGSGLSIQAAKRGHLAVSYERIGFGERREQKINNKAYDASIYESERDVSLHSLLIGNTLLGETVKELMLITKWLKAEYSNKNIWIIGYSAAGTSALAAAALDDNIDGIAVGGCVGYIKNTILKRRNSGLSTIPNMLEWLEQDVQIGLISPKPCIIIAGKNDHIWPHVGAKEVVSSSKEIYKKDNSENNLVLLEGNKGHTYYPELMWSEISKFLK